MGSSDVFFFVIFFFKERIHKFRQSKLPHACFADHSMRD
jgi:hypothetical protein